MEREMGLAALGLLKSSEPANHCDPRAKHTKTPFDKAPARSSGVNSDEDDESQNDFQTQADDELDGSDSDVRPAKRKRGNTSSQLKPVRLPYSKYAIEQLSVPDKWLLLQKDVHKLHWKDITRRFTERFPKRNGQAYKHIELRRRYEQRKNELAGIQAEISRSQDTYPAHVNPKMNDMSPGFAQRGSRAMARAYLEETRGVPRKPQSKTKWTTTELILFGMACYKFHNGRAPDWSRLRQFFPHRTTGALQQQFSLTSPENVNFVPPKTAAIPLMIEVARMLRSRESGMGDLEQFETNGYSHTVNRPKRAPFPVDCTWEWATDDEEIFEAEPQDISAKNERSSNDLDVPKKSPDQEKGLAPSDERNLLTAIPSNNDSTAKEVIKPEPSSQKTSDVDTSTRTKLSEDQIAQLKKVLEFLREKESAKQDAKQSGEFSSLSTKEQAMPATVLEPLSTRTIQASILKAIEEYLGAEQEVSLAKSETGKETNEINKDYSSRNVCDNGAEESLDKEMTEG